MPWYDRDRNEKNDERRIANALEGIERILERAFPPPSSGSIDIMAVPTGPVAPGDVFTVTATFVDAAGVTVNEPIDPVSSDASIVTVVSDGAVGVSVLTCTAVAIGSAQVTSSATNPSDGSVVSTGTNNPFTVTVAAAADLGVAVNVV
jgi:hypothetical protein